MNRLAASLATAALATGMLALGGCSSYPSVGQAVAQATPQAAVDGSSLLSEGVLTVGVNSANAPYAWQPDASVSDITGSDVDVAIALADEMGLTVRFVNVGENGFSQAGSSCDVVMGVGSSQVAGTSVNVVANYAETAPAVFGLNPSGVVSLDTLAAARVGVQADSASAKTLATKLPALSTQQFSTLNDAFDALSSGAVDYVVCDSYLGGYLATSYDGVGFAGALDAPTARGIAVSATNSALQSAVSQAFDAIAGDGILDVIRTSWVGDLPSAVTDKQVTGSAPAAPAQAAAEQPAPAAEQPAA